MTHDFDILQSSFVLMIYLAALAMIGPDIFNFVVAHFEVVR